MIFQALKNILMENLDTQTIKTEFKNFLTFCKDELDLERLPKIYWEVVDDVGGNTQPSFGSFHNGDQSIRVAVINRHPLDVMRTLAHELVHYKQYLEGRITPQSGTTGSNEENEAHAIAGIIMRNWNRNNPDMFKSKAIKNKVVLEDDDVPSKIKLRGFGPDTKKSNSPRLQLQINQPIDKVNDWIKKMYSSHHRNPMDAKQFVMTFGGGDKLAMVELVPDRNRIDTVDIQWFQTYPKRSGIGAQAMKEIQDSAEEAGITLVLQPWEKGQISHSDLVNFYKKVGFQLLKGTTNTMIWVPPKTVTEDAPIGVDQEAGIGIDGKNFKFKVKDLIAKAKDYPVKSINPEKFKKQLADINEPEDSKKARTDKAELQYPIIVVKYSSGVHIADGTHRVRKALAKGLKKIPAHIIPIEDMTEFMVENDTSSRIFYHITQTSNLPNILRKGLIPTIGSLASMAAEIEPAIYMFASLEDVEDALMNWLGDNLPDDEPTALIKINLPDGFDVSEDAFEYVVHEPIPSSALKVITRNLDNDFDKIMKGELDESELLGGSTPTVASLAKKYNVTPNEVVKELRKGINVELEHTPKHEIAREIALDHLNEKLNYYTELAKIEK